MKSLAHHIAHARRALAAVIAWGPLKCARLVIAAGAALVAAVALVALLLVALCALVPVALAVIVLAGLALYAWPFARPAALA
jgi:hypothetical protein